MIVYTKNPKWKFFIIIIITSFNIIKTFEQPQSFNMNMFIALCLVDLVYGNNVNICVFVFLFFLLALIFWQWAESP